MMALYEVTNGYMGESYIRCYAWADSEAKAREMAFKRFKVEGEKFPYPPDYWENLECRRLFAANDAPFSTLPSGDGFDLA